jgi:hypothetical protein
VWVPDLPFQAAFSEPLPAVSRNSVRGFFEPGVVKPPWNVRNTTPDFSALTKKNFRPRTSRDPTPGSP